MKITKPQQSTHLGEASSLFLTYVRTKMFYQQRMREEDGSSPVHISTKEIELNFFKYPRFNRKTEIHRLIDTGELEITLKMNVKGFTCLYYKALRAGAVDWSLLRSNSDDLDFLTLRMKEYLKLVSLSPQAPSTPYFDAFLKFNPEFPDLFFVKDQFQWKNPHTDNQFSQTHRPNILLQGKPTTSFDVTTMQPLLLGKILKAQIGHNEFSNWIDSGEDIYQKLQLKANLRTRDEGKKRFFEILFAKPNNALELMFGASAWIKWINQYKSQPEYHNPHSNEKTHSNLAWLLQSTEVMLMRKVWELLEKTGIPFLSVHDEIIVKEMDASEASELFHSILKPEFSYYKLNTKK